MTVNDFIGKTVIDAKNGARYRLHDITSPCISVVSENISDCKHPKQYVYNTINGDPILNGTLIFEDESLTAEFAAAYEAYCRSMEAYWEDYGYWMRRD